MTSPYNGNGCGYDGYGYGIGVPMPPTTATLDIKASVGTSTSPTSTGTKAVIGVGFQPKLVMPFGQFNNVVGSTSELVLGVGAFDSASQFGVGVGSKSGVTTTVTTRGHSAGDVIKSVYDGTDFMTASKSSLDSDGFTLNWSRVRADARILNHIALGGDDFERSITLCQMNNTNAAQSFAHGLSGAPTGVLFFSASNATAPAVTSTEMHMSLGAWSSNGQWSAGVRSRNGVTTTSCSRSLSNSTVVTAWRTTGGWFRTLAVDSVDATNVNGTYVVTDTTSQYYFWMLAIRGAKCQVGTFDCNDSTDPLTISCAGITPKLWLGVGVPGGVDNVGTVQNDARLSIMASDGTNNVSCGITDANGVTTTNARRFQSSTSFEEYNMTGVLYTRATFAFSGESVVITPTVNETPETCQGAYIIIGA